MLGVRASTLPSRRLAIVPERLESCVRRLDPADRALLDLSLNRGIPDAAMAPILRTDPVRLAWKRARAIERIASRLGMTHPADLADVRTALMDLPSRAWLPLELQPARQPPVLEPPEPAGVEPLVFKPRDPAEVRASLRAVAAKPAAPPSTALMPRRAAPPRPEPAAPVAVTRGRRATMRTRARRAAGALALGAAAAFTLLRRS